MRNRWRTLLQRDTRGAVGAMNQGDQEQRMRSTRASMRATEKGAGSMEPELAK